MPTEDWQKAADNITYEMKLRRGAAIDKRRALPEMWGQTLVGELTTSSPRAVAAE
jgi:hypothetical protein